MMKSFLCVEKVERKFVRCEVENVPIEERPDDAIVWDCFFDEVNRELFFFFFHAQGDIFSCFHENGKVLEICKIEAYEKERRIRLLMNLI